jgi:hypothetical protein
LRKTLITLLLLLGLIAPSAKAVTCVKPSFTNYNFGLVVTGTSSTASIALTNNCGVSKTVTLAITTNPDFQVTAATPFTLQAGRTTYITIKFTPRSTNSSKVTVPESAQFALVNKGTIIVQFDTSGDSWDTGNGRP